MLFAVEGGGFFSSSASGYSKGLALLLLGQKNEERPMRVSPWNRYHLVEQEADSDLQLASGKNRVPRGCAAFVCFGCTSSGLEGPFPPKVGPIQQDEMVTQPPAMSDKSEDGITDQVDEKNIKKVCIKSSLKKSSNFATNLIAGQKDNLHETSGETGSEVPGCTERRKVQWTDACGRELVEIREFELSDAGASDEELEGGVRQSCSCVIM